MIWSTNTEVLFVHCYKFVFIITCSFSVFAEFFFNCILLPNGINEFAVFMCIVHVCFWFFTLLPRFLLLVTKGQFSSQNNDGAFPISNLKQIVETETKWAPVRTPNTHVHDRSLYCLGTGRHLNQNGWAKLDSSAQTSHVSEILEFTFSLCKINRSLQKQYSFSFFHCIVCPSSICGCRLPLWYLQTFLPK